MGDEVKGRHVQYGELTQVYKDQRNYYLWINDEDVQVLPRADFVAGEEAMFETFISHKIRKEVIPLQLPLKKRLAVMNTARKQAEAMHDEKIVKKREERKNAKANKK